MYFFTIWLGTSLIFIIPRLAPGDPIEAMVGRLSAQAQRIENSAALIAAWRARFGLDAPLWLQYLRYMRNLLTFDLGYSLTQFPATVLEMVQRALPWTIGLLMLATLISFVLGTTIGALMGWRRTPEMLRSLLPLSLTFTSVPFFMLGILILYVFGFTLKLFPISGGYDLTLAQGLNWPFVKSVISHGIMPATAIVIASMGFWALGMRGMMITTDGEDYMVLADAKGLSPWRIFWLYAVRNSVLPQVTALALTLGSIVAGSVLVEYLFSYPGVGYLLYLSIVNSDYTLIQGITFILIVATATTVLIIDLIYPLIDPRITYQKH
jgi:peptide/nickel transport system permease protein